MATLDLSGVRILVVEDHDDSRDFLAMVVASLGATPLHASDGEEGLRLARAEHPDLVLCDLWMPRMDGFEFVGQLRRDDTLCGVRVIAVTAVGSEADLERTWTAGFSGCLTKPLDLTAFEALLQRVFWQRRKELHP